MHTATQTLGEPHARHAHRKRMAKIYLAAIAAIIFAADALLLGFVLSEYNPWAVLMGVLVGQIGSTPFLIAGIFRRLNWARFVLIGLLFVVLAIFSLVAVQLNSRVEYRDTYHMASIFIAVVLLTVANTWLIRSKRIQHLARTGESAGQ